MRTYPKIQTIWKRDQNGRIIYGEYSTEEIEYLANNDWEWTEKVDGTNIRIYWDGECVHLDGRTDNAQLPSKLVDNISSTITADKLRSISKEPFTLFGEGYGAGIQKGGGNYSATQQFILFDALFGEWWLKRDNLKEIANTLDIRVVPVVGIGNLDNMMHRAQHLTCVWAEQDYPVDAEGIVARPATPLLSRNGEPIMVKIKKKDFKHND